MSISFSDCKIPNTTNTIMPIYGIKTVNANQGFIPASRSLLTTVANCAQNAMIIVGMTINPNNGTCIESGIETTIDVSDSKTTDKTNMVINCIAQYSERVLEPYKLKYSYICFIFSPMCYIDCYNHIHCVGLEPTDPTCRRAMTSLISAWPTPLCIWL